jgi:hypothetical protein
MLRAWGTDDPRLLPLLRAENQAGQHRRTKVVEQRAQTAGWPRPTMDDERTAATAAVRRLEGMDFSHRGQSRRSYRQKAAAAAYEQRQRVEAHIDEHDPTGEVVTIFDE